MTYANANVSSILGLFEYSSSIFPPFGIFILLSVFFVSFLSSKNYGTKASLMASLILTTIISIFLRIVGLVQDIAVVFLVISSVGYSIYFFLNRD